MRDLKNVQPLADFDWDAVASEQMVYAAEDKEKKVNDNDEIVEEFTDETIQEVLDLCDGFLVTGGIDVHPKWFNEEMNGTGETNEELDAIDKAVIDYAVKNKKPMMGICRGHQVINVFMGGSLIQDIGSHHRSTRHKVYMNENDFCIRTLLIQVNYLHRNNDLFHLQ